MQTETLSKSELSAIFDRRLEQTAAGVSLDLRLPIFPEEWSGDPALRAKLQVEIHFARTGKAERFKFEVVADAIASTDPNSSTREDGFRISGNGLRGRTFADPMRLDAFLRGIRSVDPVRDFAKSGGFIGGDKATLAVVKDHEPGFLVVICDDASDAELVENGSPFCRFATIPECEEFIEGADFAARRLEKKAA